MVLLEGLDVCCISPLVGMLPAPTSDGTLALCLICLLACWKTTKGTFERRALLLAFLGLDSLHTMQSVMALLGMPCSTSSKPE